ncbi:nucleotide-binding universal stress UspA family protein [Kitasatospora sp. GP30]|uniref:universal stress protein n=1 Tax=Kitasatospora sp. GP30 TaxID=3035084 RepID=UPI000C7094B1|nr:universal stress protein [Kitasatospora sp. GP30]MDH6145127.1 nucleotide-binding universal stress UspA family protein [Kitasatospora sp. GP30]
MGGRIVAGVSGSLGSLAALHRAVGLARQAEAELLVVLVWTPPGGEYGFRRAPCPPLLSTCRDAAVQRLREAMAQAFPTGGVGVRLSCVAVRGEPGAALVAAADRPDDLLVIGAGGRRWWRRLWPSVARYCQRRAGCPVLTVPRPELQRELDRLTRRLALAHVGY